MLEDRVRFVLASGSEFGVSNREPAVAWARARNGGTAAWPGLNVRSEAAAALTSDEQAFHLTITLNVWANDSLFFQRQWVQSVERCLM